MMEPDPGIACRLLKACWCLYSIGLGGVEKNPYFGEVGFVQPPTVQLGGRDRIDACLVGRNADGVMLAFRGTIPPDLDERFCQSLADWANDFNLELEPATGLPGRIHGGLARSLDGLWDQFLPEVLKLTADGTPLYVTGHSKGCLLACYAALRLALEGHCRPRAVYVFGSPSVGDPEFAARYQETIAEHWRYEARNDVVPFLPQILPCLALRRRLHVQDPRYDFRQVGTLRYIDRKKRLRPDSPGLARWRAASLPVMLLARDFVAAHFPTTGYVPGICGEAPKPRGPHEPFAHVRLGGVMRCVLQRLLGLGRKSRAAR
jgi:hypothetical protein